MTGHSLVPMAARAGRHVASPTCASRSCEARMWDDAKQLNALAATLGVRGARRARGRRRRMGGAADRVRVPRGRRRRRRSSARSGAHLEAVIRERARRDVLHAGPRARARVARARAVGAQRRAAPAVAAAGSRSTIDEHAPLARWNDAALVNTRARCSSPTCDGELPQLRRAGRRAARDDARATANGRDACAPLALTLRRRSAVARGGWRVRRKRRRSR